MILVEFGLSRQNWGTLLENKVFYEWINLKIKWYLVYKNNIDLILQMIMLGKVCQIEYQKNPKDYYFQMKKTNQTKFVLTK